MTSVTIANSDARVVHHTIVQSTGTHTELPPPAGRSAEWTRIRTAVEAAAAGTGTTVLVEGRTGSGKTHLVRAIDQLGRARGMTTIDIRCSNLAGDRAFGPVIDGLTLGAAAGCPEVGHPDLDGLAASFAELARAEPVIVTVDDFQDADLGTQRVLFALSRLAEALPIALVVAATDWPVATGQLVESVRDQLVLRPLGEDDLAQLATDTLGHRPGPRLSGMLRSTGGNPLLAVRLIEALETDGRLSSGEVDRAELPAGFCRVVERFVGDVSDDARALLRAAAVLGPAFRIDRVAAMLGRSLCDLIRPIDDLERGGVLQGEGDGRLSFAQPVVRNAIHRSLNAAEQLELSARAAHELERDDDRRALELYAHVSGAPSAGPESATSAHLRTLVRSGRYRDAEALVGATMEATGDRDAGELRAHLTEIRYHRARWNELIAGVERWLADEPETIEADRLAANLAAAHAGLGHTDTATDHARGVLDRQGPAGDPIARSIAYQVLATAMAAGTDPDEVVDLAHRAVREARRMGTWEAYRRHPHTTFAMALADAGQPDEALVVLAEGRLLSDRLTTAWDDSAYCAASAIITARLGRWPETEVHVDRGLEAVAQSGAVGPGVDLHATRMVVALGRGDLEVATSALDTAVLLLGDRPARTVPGLCRSWGALLEARGDLAGARARLLDVWEAKPSSLWVNAGPALIRVAQQTDGVASPVATGVAAAVAARASATGAPWIAAYAARCEAMVAQDSGQLRDAADRFAELGGVPDELECLVDAIRLAPTPDEADALRARAQERCAALGGAARIAGTQRSVPRQPARRARRRATRPVSGWGSLTVAEERVARLVAQGLSNAETGAELFVSARTVESHLRRIFSKLEIRKRVELAVLVSQLDDQ